MEEEQVTIPCRTTGSHANAIQPRYVPSTPMITARHSIIAKPRNLIGFPMAVHTPVIIEPRIVAHTTMVLPTPAINFLHADPKVKVINAPDVKIINALDFNVTDDLDIGGMTLVLKLL